MANAAVRWEGDWMVVSVWFDVCMYVLEDGRLLARRNEDTGSRA